MQIKIQSKVSTEKGLLVIPVFTEELKNLPAFVPKNAAKKFKAKTGEIISTFLDTKNYPEKLLLIGLGKTKNLKIRRAKEIGGKIGQAAKSDKLDELTILLPANLTPHAQSFTEGILMSQYEVDKLKNKKKDEKYELKTLNIVTKSKSKDLPKDIQKSKLISEAADFTKDLVNMPSNLIDGDYLAKEAKRIAKENRYKIVVLDQKDLEKMKWGLLLAVNQGSGKEAKCIALEYNGGKRNEKPIVIIGKGVIYDSGGYNLKPTNYIETMHQDMAGGATVLGLFEALKKLNIKKNVVGIIPVAENLINEKSYRPSDVITSFSGKTVEITNTDAEGRLILADAITYGLTFKPQNIITIATLTGAVVVALGDRYAGLISNNYTLRKQLLKAGRATDDLGWPLPLHRDHKKKLESKIADLRNCDTGTSHRAGSSKGAAFLEKFIEKTPWCHIDIGGTAFVEEPKDYQTKGATAHGLQMLIKYLED